MVNTHFHNDHTEITPNRTYAYRKDEQGRFKISIPVFDNYGATSLFTTVEDLVKWDENFYSKKIGGEAFINLMQSTGSLNDKTPENYAAGLIISNYKGYKTVEHSGADAGYRSNFIRFPEEHFSVLILANLANINPALLSYKVADLFLKDKSIKEPAFKQDNSILKSWEGDYYSKKTQSIVKIQFKNERLFMGTTELITTSNNRFKQPNSLSVLSFATNSINTELELYVEGAGVTTYTRVNKKTFTEAELEEYKGEFYSSELDVKYSISIRDKSLTIKIPRNDEIKLSPFLKDIFSGSFIIRFQRDTNDQIDGFFLSAGRVRNLYFSKVVIR